MNLSPKQQEVVARMRKTGTPLCCWPGNLWTTDPPPVHANSSSAAAPSWSCGTRTVMELERMKIIYPIVSRQDHRKQLFRLVPLHEPQANQADTKNDQVTH